MTQNLETKTQRTLFNEDANRNNKTRNLTKYITIPLVAAAILGGSSLGLIKYKEYKDYKEFEQKQTQVENNRKEQILRIAQGKEKQSIILDIISGLYTGTDSSLTDNEVDFIIQYRKDHPKYKNLQEPSRTYTNLPKRESTEKRNSIQK
ncbi:MAG: hypothetical protein WC979_10195 [Candidatus Pacearchaeota archaeon]|jgi:hypothetical protein